MRAVRPIQATAGGADELSMNSPTVSITVERTNELFCQEATATEPALVVFSTSVRGHVWVEIPGIDDPFVIPANRFGAMFGDDRDRRQDNQDWSATTLDRRGR